MSPAEVRNTLRLAGYSPIPVRGKIPAPTAWEQKVSTSPDEIARWEKIFPDATNTGILTKVTPAFDIDIRNPEAATAVEELARERFEERGYILVRIGLAPKRAIPFRTDAPFKKIVRDVVSPSGTSEKLELLADGQQVVAFGIHPDTRQPYRWHGGEPGRIRWEDLPYLSADDALALVRDAEQLLTTQFGYRPKAPAPAAAPTISGRALAVRGHDLRPTLHRSLGIVRTVASASEGDRNGTLFWGACRVRDMYVAGQLDHPAAMRMIDLLRAAADRAGLPRREVERTITSAFQSRTAA
jgi:hypothetical protein